MSGPGSGNLILPDHVARERQQIPPVPPTHPQIPEEVLVQIRPFLAEAREISTQIDDFLGRTADPGHVALMLQAGIHEIIRKHMAGIMPAICVQVCQRDRHQIFQAIQQIRDNQFIKADLSQSQTFDRTSYNAALNDLAHLMQGLPVPHLQLAVTLPEVTESDSNQDITS